MKINKEDNSIHIGDDNTIKNSVIGNNSALNTKNAVSKVPWYSKLFWKLFIPITVIVIAAVICLLFGFK